MEAIIGVVLIVGIVVWICARALKYPERPAVTPPATTPRPASASPPRGVPSLPAARTEPAATRDDGAFFDGYIWGRLEERHDQQQHGAAESHDHDLYDGDDSFDDDD